MRLLNTKWLEFGEFFESEIPKYAILSHRWGKTEVSYKELKKGQAPEGSGLKKIQGSCALAAKDGYDWIWIDTCCIDKRSSAELSEAINSMYKWYSRAAICYVYLSDVNYSPSDVRVLRALQDESIESRWSSFLGFPEWDSLKQHFRNSSWFGRGWTLQELLAPSPLACTFFDRHWTFIGGLRNLQHDVSEATGIPLQCLLEDRGHASIAQKMNWASHRTTSRGEDMAYCLLGLFNINMPLLYGEGADKAFYRLQCEILRTSDDESIFAWTGPMHFSGLLASHPKYFTKSGDFIPTSSRSNPRPRYTITNRGLQISVPSHDSYGGTTSTLTMHLHCSRTNPAQSLGIDRASKCDAVAVQLVRHKNSYLRTNCEDMECTLQQPHSSLAKIDPVNLCAIYVHLQDPN